MHGRICVNDFFLQFSRYLLMLHISVLFRSKVIERAEIDFDQKFEFVQNEIADCFSLLEFLWF